MRWLLLTAVLFLGACNTDRIAQLEKQNKELSAKLETSTQQANLDLQEKCAKQATTEFKSEEWDKQKNQASFTNHYNAKVNKCFIEVTSMSLEKPFKPNTYRTISDAFEGKDYATYYWVNDKGQKYWDVKPFMCKVTTLAGEVVFCKTTEEYEELIKQFMEQ